MKNEKYTLTEKVAGVVGGLVLGSAAAYLTFQNIPLTDCYFTSEGMTICPTHGPASVLAFSTAALFGGLATGGLIKKLRSKEE